MNNEVTITDQQLGEIVMALVIANELATKEATNLKKNLMDTNTADILNVMRNVLFVRGVLKMVTSLASQCDLFSEISSMLNK